MINLLGIILFSLTAFSNDLWLQQQNIKSLEDLKISPETWLVTTEEAGKEFFNRCRPHCGATLEIQGRDFVFHNIAPTFDRDKFKDEFINFFAAKVSKAYPQRSKKHWHVFLKDGIRLSEGNGIKEAFINLKLSEFGMDFPTWKKSALSLRESIVQKIQNSNSSFDDILEASRRYGRKPVEMNLWLKNNNLPLSLSAEISEYGRLLTLADYLPPRKASHPLFLDFLKENLNVKKYLILDVQGLGVINRQSQDKWLVSGADISKLETVSLAGDKVIDSIINDLNQKTGRDLRHYVSGDGIGFDVTSLSDKKFNEIKKWIETHPRFYGVMVDVNSSDLASHKNKIESAIIQINKLKKIREAQRIKENCEILFSQLGHSL